MPRILNRLRYQLAVFFAVLGPGFITAVVDNDAGGIITYSQAGSRMGAVTGKGLSDLIREEFGLRITFLVMALLVLVNLTNIMANFAGIAGSLELFHISRYFSVPVGAVAIWFLIVK